jgi:hypothetical protein
MPLPQIFHQDDIVPRALEPSLLPKDKASCLASVVPRSITSSAFKVYGVLHAANAPPSGVFTSLVRALENAEALSTIIEHLEHEREVFQPATFVEGRQDFLSASDFYPLSSL